MQYGRVAAWFAAWMVLAIATECLAEVIPNTGQVITPLAPAGAHFDALNPGLKDFPDYTAGQAVTTAVSPDGKTLLVLTSGYNLIRSALGRVIPDDSTQFIFSYDVSAHTPRLSQVIKVPNSYNGLAFSPSGRAFYVPGGVDDNLHVFARDDSGRWAEADGSPIGLGHDGKGIGLSPREAPPQAAGVAVSADGNTIVVANYGNDSISLLRRTSGAWHLASELDLRPNRMDPATGDWIAGGEYPYWVVIKGNDTAYVSSVRDREVVVVDIRGTPRVASRIKVPGQPNKMVLSRDGLLLFVAQDNTDSVGVIDLLHDQLVENISVTATRNLLPPGKAKFKGADTNSVTLSPDGKNLYVTNGTMNDVAVLRVLDGNDPDHPHVVELLGLIPTGWYPNSVSMSSDGKYMYVVNGKSVTGPNPKYCKPLSRMAWVRCRSGNQFGLQLAKAGFQYFPTPDARSLARLTEQAAENNHFGRRLSKQAQDTLAFLHSHIKHVIYIIKENRTYDQVLGDLGVGNGDPKLTEFGEAITPNEHALARNFVTLDNFYDSSEVSYDGWAWSTSAHSTDLVERQVPVNAAGRGLSYDSEGKNRGINIGYPDLKDRIAANPETPDDPRILPGTANAAAPDGPGGEEGAGFLWNGALRAGLTLRNYGFFVDLQRYGGWHGTENFRIPRLTDPAASHTQVAYITDAALRPHSDIYYRGFDQGFPDYYLYKEFAREFDTKFADGSLPNLVLMRLPHDHTGNFKDAIEGVNTPELQVADNDYAVGLIVQKIAGSRYRDNTLIFILEDDAQDGPDHVDSHRSTAFVIGPYVKQHQVVSTAYTTLSLYRTMEDVLGIGYSNLNDALALPMTDVFDTKQEAWHYTAAPSALLYNTKLPLPKRAAAGPIPRPTQGVAYWDAATRGLDFSVEDRVDGDQYNRILWRGLKPGEPYPGRASERSAD